MYQDWYRYGEIEREREREFQIIWPATLKLQAPNDVSDLVCSKHSMTLKTRGKVEMQVSSE